MEHAYAPQDTLPLSTQVPLPSHVSAGKEAFPTQLDAVHSVPLGYCAQDRAPEHVPVVPQLAWDCAAHSLAGSVPLASGSQKPTRPTWLHASQVPSHAAPQQNPSAQNVDAHSVDAAHV